jgi:sugar lactone lactonase YvrE
MGVLAGSCSQPFLLAGSFLADSSAQASAKQEDVMKQEFSMQYLGRAALRLVFAVLICSVAFALSTASFAQTKATNGSSTVKPHVVTSFEYDSTHQMFPESITAGPDGYLYASVSDLELTDGVQHDLCYIVRIKLDGKRQEVVAKFTPLICSSGLLLGVAFDDEKRLHVAVADWTNGTGSGVYRVEHNGSVTQILQLPQWTFPNGIAFYEGDLYVSDTWWGVIWKKGPHDSPVAINPWFQDAALNGPNGIAFYRHSLYIALYNNGGIIRLPILHDGSPGTWQYVKSPDPRLAYMDGIAFDVTGRLWFTVNYGSDGSGGKLGILDEDGNLRILADGPGWLDYPTMVVFGTTYQDRDTLYLTNGGLNGGKPNVLSFDVDVKGMPLPAEH